MKYRNEDGVIVEHRMFNELLNDEVISVTIESECDCGATCSQYYGFIIDEDRLEVGPLLSKTICCPSCGREIGDLDIGLLLEQ